MQLLILSFLGLFSHGASAAQLLDEVSYQQLSVLRRSGEEGLNIKPPAYSAVVAFADSFTDSGE